MLPRMPLSEQVAADYQTTRLSLKAHPMAFLRTIFNAENVLPCAALDEVENGGRARIAGVVLVRQRPGNGNAIFVTVEDEGGIANIVIWARLFECFRREVMAARLMLVDGVVQKSPEGVIHLMAEHIDDRTAMLGCLSQGENGAVPASSAAEWSSSRHPRDVRILPGSRDFH